MRIYDQRVCHIENPLGFQMDQARMQFKVECEGARALSGARIRVYSGETAETPIFDSGFRPDVDPLGYTPDLTLSPRTRYWWDASAKADTGEECVSERAWFETGKRDEPWRAKWIAAEGVSGNAVVSKRFGADKKPVRARLYICGLGLYEAYLNGVKLGNEYLTPDCNAYDQWLQVQTYDATDALKQENELTVMLGDGWYKGRFGFTDNKGCVYGDTQALIAEMILTCEDGTEEVVATDMSWQSRESKVRFANIYDGEVYDDTYLPKPGAGVKEIALGYERLTDRVSLPVIITETRKPIAVLHTPKGETVLDMGQIMTGWLSFISRGEKGHTYHLRYGEVLQNDCFYTDNLRTAKAEYTYTADGTQKEIRPYFTFYGFRYIKLEGFGENPDLTDFTGCVVHSDIRQTAWVDTANEKINRLALNALWGQRGNFLDVPTDCPQRDERMGWTGDAQAFCATACFQMDSAAFYDKYLYDMRKEQSKYAGGVPHVVPAFELGGSSSCAWADAACVMPWTIYLFYGDKALLRRQYPGMRDWVEWIYNTDEKTGGARLWRVGFHFADWLALDTEDGTPIGATDSHFVASAFYYYSATLAAKAARALGYAADEARYENLAGEIRRAIQHEYFTATGRLAVTTQTAYILALYFGFAPESAVPGLVRALDMKFDASAGQLRTGFVGTSYLCETLTKFGMNRRAYSLFLREEYPGWLYEVNLGATTVWERWNSLLPDGRISDTGMNSLNHYAYGAVMEWYFRDVVGINPVEDAPGFRKAVIAPKPDPRLKRAQARFESPMGLYESGWEIKGNQLAVTLRVPFLAQAEVILPAGDVSACGLSFKKDGKTMRAVAQAGAYEFAYTPFDAPWDQPDADTLFSDIQAKSPDIWADMVKTAPFIETLPAGKTSVRALIRQPFGAIDPAYVEKLDTLLRAL